MKMKLQKSKMIMVIKSIAKTEQMFCFGYTFFVWYGIISKEIIPAQSKVGGKENTMVKKKNESI